MEITREHKSSIELLHSEIEDAFSSINEELAKPGEKGVIHGRPVIEVIKPEGTDAKPEIKVHFKIAHDKVDFDSELRDRQARRDELEDAVFDRINEKLGEDDGHGIKLHFNRRNRLVGGTLHYDQHTSRGGINDRLLVAAIKNAYKNKPLVKSLAELMANGEKRRFTVKVNL